MPLRFVLRLMGKLSKKIIIIVFCSTLSFSSAAMDSNMSQFIYVSTWIQTVLETLGFGQLVFDFIVGYLYYKKGSTSEVKELKNELEVLLEEKYKFREDEIKVACKLIDKIINTLESEEVNNNELDIYFEHIVNIIENPEKYTIYNR